MARTRQSDLYQALTVLKNVTGTAERESPYLSLSHSPQGWKVVEIETRTMGERDIFGARRRPAGEMLSTMAFAIEAVLYARDNREEAALREEIAERLRECEYQRLEILHNQREEN